MNVQIITRHMELSDYVREKRYYGPGSPHWFKPNTMKYFRSRLSRTAYEVVTNTSQKGRIYFVSSEQYEDSHGWRGARRYTIRIMTETGEIRDGSRFMEFATSGTALKHARKRAERFAEYLSSDIPTA